MNAFALVTILSLAPLSQPVDTIDLGSVTPPRSIAQQLEIGSGQVRWHRLVLPPISHPESWLDIWTEAGAPPVLSNADTIIALYDALGARVALDDDDGPVRYSAISLGATSPARPVVGGSLSFNGRDGPLAGGVYYLGVSAFRTDYGLTGWSAVPRSTATGNVLMRIEAGCTICPTALAGTPTVTPHRAYTGQNVLLQVQVAPGEHPISTGLEVSVDLSGLGGPSLAILRDDGLGADPLGGDNVHSIAFVLPSRPPAPLSLPIHLIDDQGRSAALAATLLVAPETEWGEQFHGGGDAGDGLDSAQGITRPVTAIGGSVGAWDADLYLLRISDPEAFSASTEGTPGDTQLFLFDACAQTGVAACDDADGSSGVWARVTGRYVPRAGNYVLAITSFDRDPTGSEGFIWRNVPVRGERAPDAPFSTFVGWEGTGVAGETEYVILLSGCEGVSLPLNCAAPCPADFDGSGEVNPDDLGDFITCYFSEVECPRADFDGSGTRDPDDLGDFITAYFATGPSC